MTPRGTKTIGRTFLLALSFACAACSDDAKPESYERVVPFEESPLAILADGDSLIVALPAELVRIDAGGAPLRLTDGRYRECPWRPSEAWDPRWDPPPRLTPDGEYITFSTTWGTWAWPLAGGDVVPLARPSRDFGAPRPELPPPHWSSSPFEGGVAVLRDGDGWIAYGATETEGVYGATDGPPAIWSLGPDGSAREEIFRFSEDTGLALARSPTQKSYTVHTDADGIYALVLPPDQSVRRAILGRIDRSSKKWNEMYTWRRQPGEPLTAPRLELATVTPSHVMVLVEDQIFRVAKTGGPAEAIGACSGCSVFVSDATHLYWFDELRLRRAPLDGVAVEDVLSLEGGRRIDSTLDLAVTGEAIWWTMLEGPDPSRWTPWVARRGKP